MRRILGAAVATSIAGAAFAGTAERREAVGCGIAISPTWLRVEYAAPLDGQSMQRPGVDGETRFSTTGGDAKIRFRPGKKYCVKGAFIVSPTRGGSYIDSGKAYLQ